MPFAPEELTELTDAEIFGGIAKLMRELRRRNLIRSEKAPHADYAEALVARFFGVPVEPHGAQPGHDLCLEDGRRVQVKCRRATASSTPGHYGDFSSLGDDPFDVFVGVVFDEDYRVSQAWMASIDRVRALSRSVHGKQRLTIRALAGDPEATELDLRSVQLNGEPSQV